MIAESVLSQKGKSSMLMTVCFLVIVCVIGADGKMHKLRGKYTSEFQAVIDRTFPGDTVYIPEGRYVVDSSIQIRHGLTVLGAGASKTVIAFDSLISGDAWAFRVKCSQGRIRFSGFSVKGCAPFPSSGILMKNNCSDFRIDHCSFEKCYKRAVEVHGDARGVIDHNRFIDNWYTSVVVFGNGEQSWNEPLSLGSGNAVYVEDNFFTQRNVGHKAMAHHIASNNGSRYVFRYNICEDGYMASHSIDAHGNKHGWKRGSRSYEIYGNKIKAVHRWAGINIRGGDGVIFDNEIEGEFISPLHLMHEGREGDGNCEYPCLDQIRKIHIWGNTYNGQKILLKIRHPHLIQYDREVILDTLPGYKPYRYPHPLVKH